MSVTDPRIKSSEQSHFDRTKMSKKKRVATPASGSASAQHASTTATSTPTGAHSAHGTIGASSLSTTGHTSNGSKDPLDGLLPYYTSLAADIVGTSLALDRTLWAHNVVLLVLQNVLMYDQVRVNNRALSQCRYQISSKVSIAIISSMLAWSSSCYCSGQLCGWDERVLPLPKWLHSQAYVLRRRDERSCSGGLRLGRWGSDCTHPSSISTTHHCGIGTSSC